MGWEKKQNKKKQATGDKAEQRLYKEGLALHLCGLFIIPNRGNIPNRGPIKVCPIHHRWRKSLLAS